MEKSLVMEKSNVKENTLRKKKKKKKQAYRREKAYHAMLYFPAPEESLLCLYDKQNTRWLLVDMEFLFSCSTRREIPYLRAPMYYSLFIT